MSDQEYDGVPDELESTLVSSARRADPEAFVARLGELGWTVATAESLTGGLVAAEIVSVSGASRVFRGGIVAYATDLKHSLLGVEEALLAAHGPVHPRVARQMAEGVRRATAEGDVPADVGIATTGVAGPLASDGHPVGTVVIAVSTPLGSRVETLALSGDRSRIRRQTTERALRLAMDAL